MPESQAYSNSWSIYTRCNNADIYTCLVGSWSGHSNGYISPPGVTIPSNDPTVRPTNNPVVSAGNGGTSNQQDVELENFQYGSYFNGIYIYQGQDSSNYPYYVYSGGRTLWYDENIIFSGQTVGNYWLIGDNYGGPSYMRCRCGIGYTNCDQNDFSNCIGSAWSGYANLNARICLGTC